MAKPFGIIIPVFVALLCYVSFTPIHVNCRNISPEIQRQIDEFIERQYLPQSGITGLGLAIVQNNGELLYTSGFGMANIAEGIKNSNDTQFAIGSISKGVTALVAAKVLHEQFPELGEAVLDTPIAKLMPRINFTLIDRFRSEQTTFRDLLAHRVCLDPNGLPLLSEPFEERSEYLYRQRYYEETCGVRTNWVYNNHMYALAGELAGVLANSSFEPLAESLFREIGMTNASFIRKSDNFTEMLHRAQPYYILDNVTYPFEPELIKRVIPSNPAGGLTLTPNDAVQYLRLLLNKGEIDGRQIVPAEVINWLHKPAITVPRTNYKDSEKDLVLSMYGYGLGFLIGSYDGWKNIQHSGHIPPYSSLLSLYPSHNLGIFSSSNVGPERVDSNVLHTFIFETLKGGANATEKFAEVAQKSAQKSIQSSAEKSKTLKEFINGQLNGAKTAPANSSEVVGKYGSGPLGDLDIFEAENNQTNSTGIYLSHGKWAKGWVENVNGTLYKVVWDTAIVQDNYAAGSKDDFVLARISNGTVDFVEVGSGGREQSAGKFYLGVSLDNLPAIPWSPGSCGPE